MGGMCQGPIYGPYTKRISEEQEESVRRLEKMLDEREHSEESRAAIEKLILIMREAVESTRRSGIDLSARERNMLWQRRNPHLVDRLCKFPDHSEDNPLSFSDLRRLYDHSDQSLVEGDD